MDPVNRLNQVVLLLRKQLAERAKAGAAKTASGEVPAKSRSGQTAPPLSESLANRLEALRKAGVDDERALARTLIEEILKAEFGEKIANDAAFQQIVDKVVDAIEGDQELRRLRQRVMG